MKLTILDTGLSRTDPYVIIDENEKVLAASYEENGEHSKAGLLRLTGELATLRAQLAEAREALEKIANDPDCNISGSDYRIGVADGCRQAAITAKHYLQKVTTA